MYEPSLLWENSNKRIIFIDAEYDIWVMFLRCCLGVLALRACRFRHAPEGFSRSSDLALRLCAARWRRRVAPCLSRRNCYHAVLL